MKLNWHHHCKYNFIPLYCSSGKDRIIFATKEDHDEYSKATYLLEDDGDDEPGMILQEKYLSCDK